MERRRHDGGAAAKGSDLTVQNKTDRPASAEQAWNKARRRRGAWHGDAVERSGRRMGAPQRIASMRSSMPMPHEQGGRFARSTRRQERV